MHNTNKLRHPWADTIQLMRDRHRRWFHVLIERLPEKDLNRVMLVKKLANRLNVAESTVYSWLNGNREVTPDELRQIAREAGLTVSELLEEDVYYLRDEEERRLMDKYRSMTLEERLLLLKIIDPAGEKAEEKQIKIK